mgnify:CR=1 FL=1
MNVLCCADTDYLVYLHSLAHKDADFEYLALGMPYLWIIE